MYTIYQDNEEIAWFKDVSIAEDFIRLVVEDNLTSEFYVVEG